MAELKIDRSFVMTMEEDPANALIVRSIVDLSHNLGLTIVAEGVETESELITLEVIRLRHRPGVPLLASPHA